MIIMNKIEHFEEDTEVFQIQFDVLCITEDELMSAEHFFDVLNHTYSKNEELNIRTIKHIGTAQNISLEVSNLIHNETMNPLSTSIYDEYVYFFDLDRFHSSFYEPGRDESLIHSKRIYELKDLGLSEFFLFPSNPCAIVHFIAFHISDPILINTNPDCQSPSCNPRMKFLNEACVICKMKQFGGGVGQSRKKELFGLYAHYQKNAKFLRHCIEMHKKAREIVFQRNVNINDLKLTSSFDLEFFICDSWFSTIDIFIERYFRVETISV
jgi:hypothetical protein